MKKIYIIITILFILTSCNKDKSNISYLDIFYLEKGMSANSRIDCEFIKGNWDGLLHNKVIKDKEFLKKFELQYLKYRILNSKINIDARIKVLIYFNNKKTDTLCLGEFFDTLINNEPMNDNNKLLEILKTKINYDKPITIKLPNQ